MTTRFSLRRHLLTRLLALVLPIVGIGMAVHWRFQESLLERQFDESLAEKASILATLVTSTSAGPELEFADEFMPQYSRAERPYYFQVRRPDGSSLERSYSLRGEDLPDRRGTLEEPAVFEATLADGARVRGIGIAFPERLATDPSAPPAPAVAVALAADAALLEEKLAEGLAEVAITGIVSVAGIAIFVAVALRRAVRLLDRVVEEVGRIGPAALAPVDELRAPEEIRPIVAALNRSVEELRVFVERERRFTADVAHELRTPIAELRASADVALRWPEEDSWKRLAGDAHAISVQMGSLVESLLELATLEAKDGSVPGQAMDLRELVAAVLRRTAGREPGDRTFDLEAPASAPIVSRPDLWEVAARNLVDNAGSHSPPGARIHVRVGAEGDGGRLSVSNPTDSIDADGVARCTDRLWRARREPGGPNHFGLGLSIVRAACAQMGHRLEVALSEGVFHATISPVPRSNPSPKIPSGTRPP